MTERLEMLTNRIKCALYMQRPNVKKAEGYLHTRNQKGEDTVCALGAMCMAMDIEETSVFAKTEGFDEMLLVIEHDGERFGAPRSLVESVGLKDSCGGFHQPSTDEVFDKIASVLDADELELLGPVLWMFADKNVDASIPYLNDNTRLSIQQMGKILGTMVCGGSGTPFTKIEVTEEEFDQAYAKALEDDEFFRTVVYE